MTKTKISLDPLVIISIVVFLDTATYGIIVPLIPDFVTLMDLTQIQVSSLFSFYGAIFLFLPIPFGILSSKFNQKKILFTALLIKSAALFGFTLVETYTGLLTVRIVDALASSAIWVICLSAIPGFYPLEKVGSKFGIAFAASEAGAFAGPLISGPLADGFGNISIPFYFMCIVCTFASCLITFMPEPQTTAPTRSPFQELKAMMNNSGVWGVGILLIIEASFIGMLEALYPLYLNQQLDFSRIQISVAFAITTGAFVVTMPLAGRFSSADRPFPMIATGLLIAALTTPGLVLFKNTVLIAGCLAFNGFGWALCLAPTFPLFTKIITGIDSHFGIAFGLSNVFFATGFALGPVFGAGLVHIGGIQMAFPVFSIIIIGVLIFTKYVTLRETTVRNHSEHFSKVSPSSTGRHE